MPILLDGSHPPPVRIAPGDVLMVAREMQDKETKKPFTWRYFMIATKVIRQRIVHGIRLGAPEGKDKTSLLLAEPFHPDGLTSVHYLPPDEWPDGVHALRMKLILEGRIDELI